MPALEHPTDEELGQHLAEIRRTLGLDVATVAGRAGLAPRTIVGIEAGTYACSLDELEDLAFALGVTLTTIARHWDDHCPMH